VSSTEVQVLEVDRRFRALDLEAAVFIDQAVWRDAAQQRRVPNEINLVDHVLARALAGHPCERLQCNAARLSSRVSKKSSMRRPVMRSSARRMR